VPSVLKGAEPGLRGQALSPTIGVLSGYLAGSYQGLIIPAVVRAVSAEGGKVVAIQTVATGSDYHQEVTIKDLAHVGWARIAGFITIANAVPLEYLQALRGAGKPVVSIGNVEPGFACPTVVADNAGGAKQAVEHLLAHGHRRIAFVGFMGEFDIRERYEAYRSTLLEHGIQPDPELLFQAENNLEHGATAAAQALLAAGLPSTAVFAATDLTAVGILMVLKEAGLQLPRDQAVVGFDDDPDAALVSPSLSTVSHDPAHLGRLAAELLLHELSGEPVGPGCHIVPTSYLARESCGCVTAEGRVTSPGRRGGDEPITAFMHTLRETVPLESGGDHARSARLASEMGNIYSEAARHAPSVHQLARLGQLCQDLCTISASGPTSDAILSLAEQLGSQMAQSPDELVPGVTERLALCTYQVRLTLATALLAVRNDAYFELRKMVRDDYKITLDLLYNRDRDPRLLDWLTSTEARAGVLGLWRKEDADGRGPLRMSAGQRTLDIAGTFDASGKQRHLSAYSTDVESFPPEELLAEGEELQVVCVFPLKSAKADWGFLAIAQPLVACLAQEAYFTWSALFSEALYQRELLSSLSERSEELAISSKREREMAGAVRESEQRYALAALAANDGLWDWDLTTGTIYLSRRLQEMLGIQEADADYDPAVWLDRVYAEDSAGLRAAISALKTGQSTSMTYEHRVQARDGRYLWVLCRGIAVPGLGAPATRIVGSMTDVTERRSLEEQLRQQALYDNLTGLPNRELFLDRLSQAMAGAKRQPGHAYTVLWLDLDNFKRVNDTMGHLYGDELLVQVADRIRGHVRESDTAARFGGDEFLLLLQNTNDTVSVEEVVGRLSEHLNQPYVLRGEAVSVTASIGVAVGSACYGSPDEILRDADTAMYSAKSSGRASYMAFDVGVDAVVEGTKV
jgi:diguanylate cyclase (GGDEF)-like protein